MCYPCIAMSCDTSPTIVSWSFHMIHLLPSMHGHVIWYITYHRCMVMSYDTSICCHAMLYITYRLCHMIHNLQSMHGHVIWCITYQSMHGHVMCYIIYQSMHGHVIWYTTYHRFMVMSYDTSPTIDTWSYHMIHHLWSCPVIYDLPLCHVIHHLPSMHGHVIWYITYINARLCHMIHHLPSILAQVIL